MRLKMMPPECARRLNTGHSISVQEGVSRHDHVPDGITSRKLSGAMNFGGGKISLKFRDSFAAFDTGTKQAL